MSLGIIPELEAACLPRPGEYVVSHVDYDLQVAGLSVDLGSCLVGATPFRFLVWRNGCPWAGKPYVGDLVQCPEFDRQRLIQWQDAL